MPEAFGHLRPSLSLQIDWFFYSMIYSEDIYQIYTASILDIPVLSRDEEVAFFKTLADNNNEVKKA